MYINNTLVFFMYENIMNIRCVLKYKKICYNISIHKSETFGLINLKGE